MLKEVKSKTFRTTNGLFTVSKDSTTESGVILTATPTTGNAHGTVHILLSVQELEDLGDVLFDARNTCLK